MRRRDEVGPGERQGERHEAGVRTRASGHERDEVAARRPAGRALVTCGDGFVGVLVEQLGAGEGYEAAGGAGGAGGTGGAGGGVIGVPIDGGAAWSCGPAGVPIAGPAGAAPPTLPPPGWP